MGDPAGVHDLGEDAAALGVHGVGDVGPAVDLLVGDQAGLAREALAGMARVRALADDQAQGRALAVVLDDQRAGDAFDAGADAGQRRHDKSVGQFQLAEGHRGKQHAQFLSQGIGFAGVTAWRLQLFRVRLESLRVNDDLYRGVVVVD